MSGDHIPNDTVLLLAPPDDSQTPASDPPRKPARPILQRVLTLSSIRFDASPFNPASPIYRLSKVRSVDNLLLLAQDPAFQREARKIVWRPSGEKKKTLVRWRDVVRHAGLGGWRAGTLAFCIRAGVNLVLLLFRVYRTRKVRIQMLIHALFGPDSFRFGAMMGSFVFLYRLLLNSLPLIRRYLLSDVSPALPRASPFSDLLRRPNPRLTISPPPEEDDVDLQVKLSEVHHTRADAALAGAIASFALLFEKKHRRIMIAQQVFVRGLQAVVNAHNLTIPHGAVLTFGLACGQIMYAFLLRPETIPRGYVNWIQQASRIRPGTAEINRTLVREGTFDSEVMRRIKDWKGTTPHNKQVLQGMLQNAKKGDFGPPFVVCEATHPWLDSCFDVPLDRFLSVAQWMAPVYTALHLIPAVLFRPKRFAKQPVTMLLRTAWGTARSCAFLGTFVVIYQAWFCFKHQLGQRPSVPPILRKFFGSRFSFWLGGFMTCLSLFVEEKKRRSELAMYVLPKGLESAWGTLRSRKVVWKVPGGEALLCAVGMAMVMNTYQNDPEHLSRLIRGILYQFIGPN